VARAGDLRKLGSRRERIRRTLEGCSPESAPVAFSFESNHSKAWTLTDELKLEGIERLRAVIKSWRERFGQAGPRAAIGDKPRARVVLASRDALMRRQGGGNRDDGRTP
jgi:hypothetical protein